MKFDNNLNLLNVKKYFDTSQYSFDNLLPIDFFENDGKFCLFTKLDTKKNRLIYVDDKLEVLGQDLDSISPNATYSTSSKLYDNKFYFGSSQRNLQTNKREQYISIFSNHLQYLKIIPITFPEELKDSTFMTTMKFPLVLSSNLFLSFISDSSQSIYKFQIDSNGIVNNWKLLELEINGKKKPIKYMPTNSIQNNQIGDNFYYYCSTYKQIQDNPISKELDRFLIETDAYGNIHWSSDLSKDIEIEYPRKYPNFKEIKIIDNHSKICLFGRSVHWEKYYPTTNKLLMLIYDLKGNLLEKYNWNKNPDDTLSTQMIHDVTELENGNLLVTSTSLDGRVIDFFEITPNYVSVHQNSQNNILLLSPNPVSDLAQLKLDKEFSGFIKISIVDLIGKANQIYSGEANGNNSINLDFSGFRTGFYSLIVDYGTKREVVKVIKE
jgi:hypothetical protein